MAATEEGRAAARKELQRGNWDAEGVVSLHMPAARARQLLEDRRWRLSGGRWYTPDGDTYFWDISEALTVELIGETLTDTADR